MFLLVLASPHDNPHQRTRWGDMFRHIQWASATRLIGVLLKRQEKISELSLPLGMRHSGGMIHIKVFDWRRLFGYRRRVVSASIASTVDGGLVVVLFARSAIELYRATFTMLGERIVIEASLDETSENFSLDVFYILSKLAHANKLA